MFAHRGVSLQLFPVVWICLRSLGVVCYDRWVLSEGHKNYFNDWCLKKSQPTFFLTYFNLFMFNPDNFESYNSLKLTFTNIPGLRSNIPGLRLLIVNLSLNQTLLTFWLYVRQNYITQLILSISLRGVIFLWSDRILILKYMVSQFHGTNL